MAKTDKEPFGTKTKAKSPVRLSGGSSPVNKNNGGKSTVNLKITKEPARKAPKIDPSINLSGGASGRSFGGGGNINLPVVRKPKTTVSLDVSGGGGGYKQKGGKVSGGGEVSLGASFTRTLKPKDKKIRKPLQ